MEATYWDRYNGSGGRQRSASPGKRHRPGLNIVTNIAQSSQRSLTDPKATLSRPQYSNRAATDLGHLSEAHTKPPQAAATFVSLLDLKRLVDDNAASRSETKEKKRNGNPFDNDTRANVPDINRSKPVNTSNLKTEGKDHGMRQEEQTSDFQGTQFSYRIPKEVSPSARTIVIGTDDEDIQEHIKNYQNDLSAKTKETSQRTPATPTIVITPAQESGPWHESDQGLGQRKRPASSIYSQNTAYPQPYTTDVNAPPVPAIPDRKHLHLATVATEPGRLSIESWERNASPTESSDCSSVTSDGSERRILERQETKTANARHQSRGWWNILSPIITRTNTLVSRKTPTTAGERPPLPTNAKTPIAGEQDAWRSEFSPETPRRIGIKSGTASTWSRWSDWERDREMADSVSPLSVDEKGAGDEAKLSQPAIHPLSPPPMDGLAAEYFQACAHDLISHVPYFECQGHSCSERLPQLISTERDLGDLPVPDDIVHATKFIDQDKRLDVPGSERSSGMPIVGPTTDSEEPGHGRNRSDSDSTIIEDEPEEEMEGEGQVVPVKLTEEAPRSEAEVPRTVPGMTENTHASPPPAPRQEQPVNMPTSTLEYTEMGGGHSGARSLDDIPEEASIQPTNPIPRSRPVDAPVPAPSPAPTPVPAYSPPRPMTRFPAPMAHYGQQPISPGPLSPEVQRTMGPNNGTPMTEMRSAGARAPTFVANHYYHHFPPRPNVASVPAQEPLGQKGGVASQVMGPGTSKPEPEAAKEKARGLSKVRRCFPKKGCLGPSPGPQAAKNRKWVILIALGLLSIVIACIVLATTLTRKGDRTPVQSQWLNLTGFPPMPTGIMTVVQPDLVKDDSQCVHPNAMWSCSLPKEQASVLSSGQANQPNFRLEIRFRNGTVANGTTVASNSTTKREVRDHASSRKTLHTRMLQLRDVFTDALYTPSPSPPSLTDQAFLGNTTDHTSAPFEGEATPFFISFISPNSSFDVSTLDKRSSSSSNDTSTTLPNLNSSIPAASTTSSGIASPARLLPLPSSQPVRLYDRGLPTEHYGFYTYFDRTIFLSSTNSTSSVSIDQDGGAPQSEANFQCTWSQTRFLVQIWTSPTFGFTLLDPPTPGSSSLHNNSTSSSATTFTRPGSLPYPITLTLDRHGGSSLHSKLLYCHSLDPSTLEPLPNVQATLEEEFRSAGGSLINPAPGLFDLDDEGEQGFDKKAGGIDGGTGGCGCSWRNFQGGKLNDN